jgi:ribonuclease HI
MSNEVILRFDGGSRGNPGLSGAGAVLYINSEEIMSIIIPFEKKLTNNQSEYMGLKIGLEEVSKYNYANIKIEGDSLLVINQLKGIWKVKNEELKQIHSDILTILKKFSKVELKHIYREDNKRADELANQAMDLISSGNLKK